MVSKNISPLPISKSNHKIILARSICGLRFQTAVLSARASSGECLINEVCLGSYEWILLMVQLLVNGDFYPLVFTFFL